MGSLKGFEVSSGEKDFVGVVRVREAETGEGLKGFYKQLAAR